MIKLKITFSGFVLLAFFSMQTVFAQETIEPVEERDYKVRPVRLGLKLGFPNVIGGNIEYVTPLFNDRLAVNVDYSNIRSDWFLAEEDDDTETTELNFSYLEGGLNYYFFKAGKGLYGGLSYGRFKFEGQTSVEKDGQEGIGEIDYSHSSIGIKLGAKIGGLFYLRPEIGYAFDSMPETVDYTANYEDGTSERETYDLVEELAVPDIFFKGFMANIGIGFAF
ncbi:hypothetical protein [Salinimicrobium sp. HB62]|uniref:hypothetical protein n=1 Tax=Salinimicrobium sp. HB62 TaxID=3077781 RepID=UPI002D765AE4|nr:hypothetical protein [Salinimicrobium sp. HB62]